MHRQTNKVKAKFLCPTIYIAMQDQCAGMFPHFTSPKNSNNNEKLHEDIITYGSLMDLTFFCMCHNERNTLALRSLHIRGIQTRSIDEEIIFMPISRHLTRSW